jgi:kynurenine formamidase
VSALDDITALGSRLSNWGRWGDDDELGTLNFITPEKRVAAAALVRTGKTFSLAIPLDDNGPMVGPGFRKNPVRLMFQTGTDPGVRFDLGGGAGFTDDFVTMPLQCSTQWDSLAHVYYGDHLYNGFSKMEVTSQGAERNGIDKVHDRFVSRGVLLDVARAKGVDTLDPAYAITADDLDEAERFAGVTVTEGDIVLLRTGLMGTHDRTGNWDAFEAPQPGLHWNTCEWFHARSVAALAGDNSRVEASDVVPGYRVPFHMVAMRDMGLFIGEFWYLEELSADCATDGVYECMLVAPALRFTRGCGSPINPLALK